MLALLAALAVATAAPTPAPVHDPIVAAAGDIACDSRPHLGSDIESLLGGCQAAQTYRLIAGAHPDAVLALGDEQYEDGGFDAFERSYAVTWGRVKASTRPTPGNHEYYSSPHADGYFAYFGARAGPPARGYYSFELGHWHIISLDGNCDFVGGCGHGSPQEQWLREDLAHHRAACTLAYWHQPRFSSGGHGSDPRYGPFWNDLYGAGADVVLNGHDHDYERFAPQTPAGAADPRRGISEFVVGTGGRSHSIFLKIGPNSEARAAGTFGVLFLTLRPRAYAWRFAPIAGYAFTDSGSRRCHGTH